MIPDQPDMPEPSAAEVYAEFCRRLERGETLEIAALCHAYPQLAAELRELHSRREACARSEWPTAVHEPAAHEPAGHETASDTAFDLRAGEQRYQVLDQLGQGGMGIVFRVWDVKLRRELAMKLIRGKEQPDSARPPAAIDARRIARFTREAEITGRLNHPGVVPVHDLALDDQGRLFFTMRLVQGQRLDVVCELARRNEEGWTQTRVLDVIVKVCETIAFAHSRHVIHRDLKPQNIMVGQFGETYVMDWGLAKRMSEMSSGDVLLGDESSEICHNTTALQEAVSDASSAVGFDSPTQAGSVLGTAPFMPPEQAAGRIDELDERSDIYSVGAILYVLLTGQQPYVPRGARRISRDVVLSVVQGPPQSIASLNPRVPAELVAICEQAMARRKDERYQSMREMADDLRAFLENRVVRAHQTGAAAELRKWFSRNRNAALAGLAAICVLVAGLASVVLVQKLANVKLKSANLEISNANREISRVNDDLREETRLKELALEKEIKATRAAESEGRRALGLLDARESASVLESNPGLALLLGLESDSQSPGFAANTAILAALAAHREKHTLTGHSGPVARAAVSPDGRLLVSASRDHTAIVWERATGKPLRWLIGHKDIVRFAEFSPDGKQIVTASRDQTAAVWDAETGERKCVIAGGFPSALSPDSRLLATTPGGGTVRLWDVACSQMLAVLTGHADEILQVAFSPDGKTAATGSKDRTARLWDVDSGSVRAVLRGHEGDVSIVLFSADGKRVLTSGGPYQKVPGDTKVLPTVDRTVRIWDAETGDLEYELKHPLRQPDFVQAAAFSPDGLRVATGATDGAVRIWDIAGESIEHTWHTQQGAISCVAFSPDGRGVAAASESGPAWAWEAATGRLLARFGGHTDGVSTISFVTDNEVATASLDHTLRIWRVRAEGAVDSPSPGERALTRVRLNFNESRLAVLPVPAHSVALCEFPSGQRIALLEHDTGVADARFSPDGLLLATLTNSGVVRIFSAAEGKLHQEVESVGAASSLAFQSGGKLVVIARTDGLISFWDPGTGQIESRLEFPRTHNLDWSNDARALVAWPQMSRDGELWDLTAPKLVDSLQAIANSARDSPHVVFSPDGTTLVTRSVELPAPQLWETATGRRIASTEFGGKGMWVVYSPEGRWFAAEADDCPARLWDARTGRLQAEFSSHERSAVRVFAGPEGERVITVSADKHSRLWKGKTGTSISLLADRKDDAVDVAEFSRDGRDLVTLNTGRDKLILWDAITGAQTALLAAGPALFSDVIFSADGRWVVAAYNDGSVRVFPARPAEFARKQGLRKMTPAERDLFQIGSEDERAAYRRQSKNETARRLFVLAARSSAAADQIKLSRSLSDRLLREFIASLPAEATTAQQAVALTEIEREFGSSGAASIPACVALAEALGERGDFERAERILRTVLESGESADAAAWSSWAAFALGGRRFTPADLLTQIPRPPAAASADLRWLLERITRGEPIRIHAGGDDFRSADGTEWRHDCFFGGGHQFGESFGNIQPSNEPIQGTTDDRLYQTERWFDQEAPPKERSYLVPLPPGRYRVVLHFAEIYFRRPEKRVLQVWAEGEEQLSDYDTLTAGFATADQQTFEIPVDDGRLDLEFRGVGQNPKVSALEIIRLTD